VFTLTGNNTGNNTLAPTLTDGTGGATSLNKSGVGTWVVSGANTYTGNTTVNAGTLAFSNTGNGSTTSANSLGQSSNVAANLVLGNASTLKYTGTGGSTDRLFTVNGATAALDASGSGAINYTNTGALAYGTANQTRNLGLTGNNTGSNTLAALIADNGSGATSVTKSGTGTWMLANNNTYTGATIINGGVLNAASLANGGSASAIGQSSNTASNLIMNGGTLQYTGSASASTDRLFTIGSGGATLDASGTGSGSLTFSNVGSLAFANNTAPASLTLTGTGNGTLDAGLSDSGSGVNLTSLVKNGSGTWLLNNVYSYTGGTTVNNGTLQIAQTNALATASNLTVNGGSFDVQANSQIFDTVNQTGGSLDGAGGALYVNNYNAQAGSVTTNILVNNNLNKNGTGITTIAAASTVYVTGVANVNAGTLIVNGALTSSSVVVSAGATLGGSGVVGDITGAGVVAPGNSPGIMTSSSVTLGAGGESFKFELTQATPNWGNQTVSGNDVLHLTGATPINGTADSSNIFDIYLGVATLTANQTFTGGIFTEGASDPSSFLTNAAYIYFVLGDGSGTHSYNGVNYYTLAEYNTKYSTGLGITAGTVAVGGAGFASGAVDGYSQEFTVVPEPGTWSLLLLGSAFLYLLKRRAPRKQDVNAG